MDKVDEKVFKEFATAVVSIIDKHQEESVEFIVTSWMNLIRKHRYLKSRAMQWILESKYNMEIMEGTLTAISKMALLSSASSTSAAAKIVDNLESYWREKGFTMKSKKMANMIGISNCASLRKRKRMFEELFGETDEEDEDIVVDPRVQRSKKKRNSFDGRVVGDAEIVDELDMNNPGCRCYKPYATCIASTKSHERAYNTLMKVVSSKKEFDGKHTDGTNVRDVFLKVHPKAGIHCATWYNDIMSNERGPQFCKRDLVACNVPTCHDLHIQLDRICRYSLRRAACPKQTDDALGFCTKIHLQYCPLMDSCRLEDCHFVHPSALEAFRYCA